MIQDWAELTMAMKILWGITLASSLIFIIQSIMTFIGIDADISTDFDVDMGGDIPDGDSSSGMGLLTFRNFVNFCMGFGWTSVLLHDQISSFPVLLFVAVLVGVALVAAIMFLFKWVSSMQQSGNIDIFSQSKSCHGKVYLTIPAHRTGIGKVQITINNSVREYDAVTDGDELSTGTEIYVVEAVGEGTLLVEKADSVII